MGLSDASFLDQARPLIAGLKRPFYAFMVTQSSHLPFEPPQRLRESSLAQPWWEEPEKRLPLLMVAKGIKPLAITIHGGQVDLLPTVLDLLGVEGATGLMGRSLVNIRRNLSVMADGTLKGLPASPEEARHCTEGREIADLVIRGDYFRPPRAKPRGPSPDLALNRKPSID